MKAHVLAAPRHGVRLKVLVGSGDRIGMFMLPFVIAGVILNIAFPAVFSVGGPPIGLFLASAIVLAVGIFVWAWSVELILTRVPRGELITTGPYALVKHPLYTDVALLALPWIGFLLNTWLGAALGVILYIGTRVFARAEEAELSRTFGAKWDAYVRRIRIPWL